MAVGVRGDTALAEARGGLSHCCQAGAEVLVACLASVDPRGGSAS